ncbi:Smad nuclear-interacting protein 1 [Entophlyctis luteolus]|nr:Smad nuclear-interacting protein 1 [Entophlyctis luteolus]
MLPVVIINGQLMSVDGEEEEANKANKKADQSIGTSPWMAGTAALTKMTDLGHVRGAQSGLVVQSLLILKMPKSRKKNLTSRCRSKVLVQQYSEPPEARKPNGAMKFRLYTFKGKEQLDMIPLNRQSAYLFGRDRKVADIPVDHPSISKQHAALQYRLTGTRDGGGRAIRPYLIDLDSANGTFLNSERMEGSRYYELRTGDVIKFGFSTRDHVLMSEEAAEED